MTDEYNGGKAYTTFLKLFRQNLIEQRIKMDRETAKIFRIKCKDKKYATGISPCSTHPHHFYIQLLAETGIIGFSFLFSILTYVLYNALRQLRSIIFKKKRPLTDYQVCLLAGILITVSPFNPNGNFFNNWLMIVYCLPVGFYLQSIYSKKNK